MCGILGILGKKDLLTSIGLEKVKELSGRMAHRGPDEHDFHINEFQNIITHERLSIIDLHTGKQPIKGTKEGYVVHNGEIYNHQALRDGILKNHTFHTTCDSEVIVHLYEEFGDDICNHLKGVFGFIVLDGEDFLIARDPIGVKPLYWGKDATGAIFVSSELKSIEDQVAAEAFPPGHYFSSKTGLVKYYQPEWQDYKVCKEEENLPLLRDALIEATRKRLMSDVPYGVLLSGGLDSSLTSSIVSRFTKEQGKTLHSFSVGLNAEAPDLKFARKVADFLGTQHHEIYFTIEEGISNLEKLIWHLETYDITSIRASTPMYFMSRYIQEQGIKVVMSGEGADEILGGYLYFHNAPNAEEFQKETIRRVNLLSTADCLRADKSTMAWGIEARVPFLDRDFLDISMKIAPEYKMPNRAISKPEKDILRRAFDDKENPWLPDEILWRQKEQFSDGVGYKWIDELIAYCEIQITDKEMEQAATLFPHNTPSTKEAMYMRKIFHKHFPSDAAAKTVLKWIPKWQKNEDPSGRANEVHEQTVEAVNV
jgi:asparagine synthase (glutamine-hydrolysing)